MDERKTKVSQITFSQNSYGKRHFIKRKEHLTNATYKCYVEISTVQVVADNGVICDNAVRLRLRRYKRFKEQEECVVVRY